MTTDNSKEVLQKGTTCKLSNGSFEAILTKGDLSIWISHPLKRIADEQADFIQNAAAYMEYMQMEYRMSEDENFPLDFEHWLQVTKQKEAIDNAKNLQP